MKTLSEMKNSRECQKETRKALKTAAEKRKQIAERTKVQKRLDEQRAQVERLSLEGTQRYTEARSELMNEIYELQKFNPETAKKLIARGAKLDKDYGEFRLRISDLKISITLGTVKDIQSEVLRIEFDVLTGFRISNQEFAKTYVSKRKLDKLRRGALKDSQMAEVIQQAHDEEFEIYMGETSSVDGIGSAFEADFAAFTLRKDAEEIDD